MKKTILVAGCALMVLSSMTASDEAVNWPYSMAPQQDLIANLTEVLGEQNKLESCEQQQQEAFQHFLALGVSINAAALMAHNQYPCDAADNLGE